MAGTWQDNFITGATTNSEYLGSQTYNLDDSYLYISHLDEGLQYWRLPTLPQTISDSMQSTFSETSALGRSAPVYTYSKSGPRRVQISIELHRDLMDDVNMNWSNSKLGYGEDYVDNLLHALQAIAVPKYNLSNKAVEPPLLALRLGREIFVKGVLSGDIGVTYEMPILVGDRYAQVKLALAISEVDPYDATSIYANGSFRGEVNTLRDGALTIGVGGEQTQPAWQAPYGTYMNNGRF